MTSVFNRSLRDPRVATIFTSARAYPQHPPFHPDERYPEAPFDEISGEPNSVYSGVREALFQLGLDAANFGSAGWNPLKDVVRPGMRVVIKPNLVVSDHPMGDPGMAATVAHGSVIRPILDYIYLATRGDVTVSIADSPIKEVDFAKVIRWTSLDGVAAFFAERAGMAIPLVDFRDLRVYRNRDNVMVRYERLPGDPEGYTPIDLGRHSSLLPVATHWRRYRSTAALYESRANQFHTAERNVYSIPNRILDADLVISVAKLKTHRKAGMTLCLKNMVGLTNEKRWLPHHRSGSPSQGGDATSDHARIDTRLIEWLRDLLVGHPLGKYGFLLVGVPLHKFYRHVFGSPSPTVPRADDEYFAIEGDWYGNDTIWRTTLDLNRALFYGQRDGTLADKPRREAFYLVDGIIAGEGDGPLKPIPRPLGAIMAGFNPASVDLVASRLMGFDPQRIPTVTHAFSSDDSRRLTTFDPNAVENVSNHQEWDGPFWERGHHLAFRASRGWRGHLEVDPDGRGEAAAAMAESVSKRA
jgi:uncharacterized protein (DUF362 family)